MSSQCLVCAQAPSNIALIKYMGKLDAFFNLPTNPSLSLTLKSLQSVAEITVQDRQSYAATWIPERPQFLQHQSNLQVPHLSEQGIQRVVQHFERLLLALPDVFQTFGIPLALHRTQKRRQTAYILRTANTFPVASGIASSASSFAALTLAVAASCTIDREIFEKVWQQEPVFRRVLARLSRQGSGSSCRSFEGPWVLWEGQDSVAIEGLEMPPLAHFLILTQVQPKKISSSEAHHLVKTSPLWESRVERVKHRLQWLMSALRKRDFQTLARVSWSEMWEMHSLFHTCSRPFSYWSSGTMECLQWLEAWIREPPHPQSIPIVTLDAGPNVHILVEKKDQNLWSQRLRSQFPQWEILEDQQGSGAYLLGSA